MINNIFNLGFQMCGVVAVIGKAQASSLVIEGLKKLEYRGYDSAGIASLNRQKLQVLKCEGKLINCLLYTSPSPRDS